MNSKQLFTVLSNSKYAGQTTCDIMHHYKKNKNCLKENPMCFTHEKLKDIKTLSSIEDAEKLALIMKENNVFLLENILPNIFRAPRYVLGIGDAALIRKSTNKSVSIVGARKCTVYGGKVAYNMAYQFAKNGYTVVSGLAYGVDIKAHRGALAAGGQTIAVLGSGILNCYPKVHQKEYDAIKLSGLILSEYGLYGKPLKHHFPFRNRLISGLSDVLVVIEAKEKSGTMITVQYALDQGKSIYAVPGSVFSPMSMGTHQLIKEGAEIVTSIEGFVQEIINFK